ncbi:hypothetical protein JTB14_022055 [Gonioctena quinquepunctata]|nr:hypothetical protein JTB14_022055 [Gonioctena quinquepunctata]
MYLESSSANHLNNYFSQVADIIIRQLPLGDDDYNYDGSIPDSLKPKVPGSFFFEPICPHEVESAMHQLKNTYFFDMYEP